MSIKQDCSNIQTVFLEQLTHIYVTAVRDGLVNRMQPICFVYIPKPEYRGEYPALVVELKWNKNVETALQQIKNKNYM